MINIAELRARNGKLTQVQLAEDLGVSVTAVKSWEKNIFSIGSTNLKKLAIYFNISSDELIGVKAKHKEQ